MKRNATAVWNGSGKEGNGTLSTQSTVLDKAQYSFNTRFADGVGTNPEELAAAAHAGCFTMKLSFVLGAAGFIPDTLETTCTIELDPGQGAIVGSNLVVKAKVPGISDEQFQTAVKDAEANCPISKLFNTAITTTATLS